MLEPLGPRNSSACSTRCAPFATLGRKHAPSHADAPYTCARIARRHGLDRPSPRVLYSQEYGWDERFEALVARVVAEFIENFDPAREHCWIAERNGEIVGSIFVVAKTKSVAKLRLLLVEPSARGLESGRASSTRSVAFARAAGYKKIEPLDPARAHLGTKDLQGGAGSKLDRERKTHDQLFGAPLIGARPGSRGGTL